MHSLFSPLWCHFIVCPALQPVELSCNWLAPNTIEFQEMSQLGVLPWKRQCRKNDYNQYLPVCKLVLRLVVIASISERSIDIAHNCKWQVSSEKKRNLNGKLKEERDKMLMAHHTLETTTMDLFLPNTAKH